MPTAKIAELAMARLEYIKKYRQNKKTAYIEEIKKEKIKKANSWWGRLWKMKEPTYQEVLKEVLDTERNSNTLFYDFVYHRIDWAYSDHERACKRLLNACQDTDTINITTADYALIKLK